MGEGELTVFRGVAAVTTQLCTCSPQLTVGAGAGAGAGVGAGAGGTTRPVDQKLCVMDEAIVTETCPLSELLRTTVCVCS